jgi:hypothetical protein
MKIFILSFKTEALEMPVVRTVCHSSTYFILRVFALNISEHFHNWITNYISTNKCTILYIVYIIKFISTNKYTILYIVYISMYCVYYKIIPVPTNAE